MATTKYYVRINGKKVPFEKLPCAKCNLRYNPICSQCEWNKDNKYNTYKVEKDDGNDSNNSDNTMCVKTR